MKLLFFALALKEDNLKTEYSKKRSSNPLVGYCDQKQIHEYYLIEPILLQTLYYCYTFGKDYQNNDD